MAIIRTAGEGASNAVKGYKDNIPDNDPNQNYSATVPFVGINEASTTNYYFVITGVDAGGFESEPSNITGTHAPTISHITPAVGSRYSGSTTTVSITGTNIFYGAVVWFGANLATSVSFNSISEISCIIPSQPRAGFVDVVVENSNGKSGVRRQGFEYIDFGIVSASVITGPDTRTISNYPIYLQVGEGRLALEASGSQYGFYRWTFTNQVTGGVVTYPVNPYEWPIPAIAQNYELKVWDPDNPTTRYQIVNIILSNLAMISNKPTQPPVVQSGSVSEYTIVGGEPDAVFTWRAYYPSGSPYGGPYIGRTYSFSAPTTGMFAGFYTLRVTDGEDFSDSFRIEVAPKIDPNSYVFYSSETLNVHLQGAPLPATVALYDLNNVNVTGQQLYGGFDSGNLNVPNELFTYTPYGSLINSIIFRARFSVNGLTTVESGTYRVIPVKTLTGTIQDEDGPVDGAKVTVIVPALPPDFLIAHNDYATTDAGGVFNLPLPFTGETYFFLVSAAGRVSRNFQSANLNPVSITLDKIPTGLEDYVISGDLTWAGQDEGQTAMINVYSRETDANFGLPMKTLGTYLPAVDDYTVELDEPQFVVKDFVVQAVREGLFGARVLTIGVNDWPQSDVDIILTPTTNSEISMATGGIYVSGQVTVSIPPGALGKNFITSFVQIYIFEVPIDTPTYTNLRSGSKVYEIAAYEVPSYTPISSFQKPILITLPFDLNGYVTGAFQRSDFVIRHAPDYSSLEEGMGLTTVNPASVVEEDPTAFWVDPIGDRQLGRVTFSSTSLSVFGIGTSKPPTTTTSSTSAADGEGSGCFIATAAFGSPLHKYVGLLKEFRDHILMPTNWGQGIVNAYYRWSPPAADFIRDHGMIRTMVRWTLLPLVGFSWAAVKLGMGPVMLLFICAAGLTGFLIRRFVRKGERL